MEILLPWKDSIDGDESLAECGRQRRGEMVNGRFTRVI
jgi:hypothetical protein